MKKTITILLLFFLVAIPLFGLFSLNKTVVSVDLPTNGCFITGLGTSKKIVLSLKQADLEENDDINLIRQTAKSTDLLYYSGTALYLLTDRRTCISTGSIAKFQVKESILTKSNQNIAITTIPGDNNPGDLNFAEARNLYNSIKTPFDASLLSAKEMASSSFVKSIVDFTGPENDQSTPKGKLLFTYVCDWKDESNFSYIRIFSDSIEAGLMRMGQRTILSVSHVNSNGTFSILEKPGAIDNKLMINSKLITFPSITTGEFITAGFMGICPEGTIKAFKTTGSSDLYFKDSFMRSASDGVWESTSGRWEILGMRHPGKSGNPFSLVFKSDKKTIIDEFTDRGKTQREGLGFVIELGEVKNDMRVTYMYEGPAKEAGMRVDDLIMAVDNKPFADYSRKDLATYISEKGEDATIIFTVKREGKKLDLEVSPGKYKKSVKRYKPDHMFIGDGTLNPHGCILAGEDFWAEARFEMSFKAFGAGYVGQIFNYVDANNYMEVRWNNDLATTHPNSIVLLKVESGKEEVLASHKGGFLPGQYYRIKVDYRGNSISASIDDVEVLNVPATGFLAGKIGISADNVSAMVVDDIFVTSMPDVENSDRKQFIETFVTDRIMKYWADPRYDWVLYRGEEIYPIDWADSLKRDKSLKKVSKKDLFGNQYRYFGDVSIKLTNIKVEDRCQIGFCATEPDLNSGYSVWVSKDGSFSLEEGSSSIANTVYPGNEIPKTIIIKKETNRIVLSDGSKAFLSAPIKEKIDGGLILFKGLTNLFEDGMNIEVSSPSTREYTFDTVPVEWEIGSGNWGTMNRWVCTPDWSYFGGKSTSMASIWTKEQIAGNATIDFYAGFAMPSYVRWPYEKPADLGITLYGNGKDLYSGCTFLLGAENNTTSKFYVNEVEDKFTYRFPISDNSFSMTFHQRWIHIQCSYIDGSLILKVDNEIVLCKKVDSIDPFGKVAIWALDNSILISRAHISASKISSSGIISKDFKLGNTGPFNNFCENKLHCRVSETNSVNGEQVFEVSPVSGGGVNRIHLIKETIDLTESPVLSFYVMPESSPMWDFYFETKGRTCKISLFGGFDIIEEVQYLGDFQTTPQDGNWILAEVNIHELLRSNFPGEYLTTISFPRFEVGVSSNYTMGGLHQNSTRSKMYIRDLAFGNTKIDTKLQDAPSKLVFNSSGASLEIFQNLSGAEYKNCTLILGDETVAITRIETFKTAKGYCTSIGFPVTFLKSEDMPYKLMKDGKELLSGTADSSGLPKTTQIADITHAGSVVYDFDNNPWKASPLTGRENFYLGSMQSVIATDLSRVWSGETRLGKSLRILCTTQSSFFGAELPVDISVKENPIFQFEYKVPERQTINLKLKGEGFEEVFTLMSRSLHTFNRIRGEEISEAEMIGDNTWHKMRLNLIDLLGKKMLSIPDKITSISFGDFGTTGGHYDGTYYLIDNLAFLSWEDISSKPVLEVFSPTPKIRTTVVVYIDDNTTSEKKRIRPVLYRSRSVTHETSTAIIDFADYITEPGYYTYEVVVRSGSGKVSLNGKYAIDVVPPILGKMSHRIIGGDSKLLWLKVNIRENSFLCTDELRVVVNGKEIAAEDMEITSLGNESLSIKLPKEYGELLGKGETLRVEITGLKDFRNLYSEKTVYLLKGRRCFATDPLKE